MLTMHPGGLDTKAQNTPEVLVVDDDVEPILELQVKELDHHLQMLLAGTSALVKRSFDGRIIGIETQ